MTTVGELKAKLADIDDSLMVLIDVGDITLADLSMRRGKLDVNDVKLGPADFGQAALIS